MDSVRKGNFFQIGETRGRVSVEQTMKRGKRHKVRSMKRQKEKSLKTKNRSSDTIPLTAAVRQKKRRGGGMSGRAPGPF